jgi:hypothetical protein
MAAKVIQQLVTELTADGAKMRAEFAKSIKDTQTWGARVTSIGKTAALGIAAAAVSGGAGLAVLTRAAINNADAIGEQAEMLGTTSERLSALSYAAQMNALSQDELTSALTKLTKTSADAFNGVGKGVQAFDVLGVSITDADGKLKDTTVLLTELSDKFSLLPEGPAKSALAMDLFGKSGSKLIPLLNQGSEGIAELTTEAERLGLVISTETARQAGEFNDQMDKLGFAADGLGLRLAAGALPQLNELSRVISDPKVQDGLEVMADGLLKIAGYAVKAGAETFKFYSSISTGLRQLASGADLKSVDEVREKLQELELYKQNFALSSMVNPFATMEFSGKTKGELAAYEQALRSALRAQNELASFAAKFAGKASGFDQTKDDTSADIESRWKKYQDELKAKKEQEKADAELIAKQKQLNNAILAQSDAYRRSLTLASESTEVQRLNYEIAYGALQGINKERAEELRLEAEKVDAMNATNRQLEDRKQLEELLMSDTERINKLWDERIAKIKTLGLSETEAADMIQKAQEQRAEEIKKATEKTTDEMSEYTKQAARNMQSAFADFLFNPFEEGLDGMLKSFSQILMRMAAEATAAQLFNSLGSWGKDNTTSGGWIGGLASVASWFGGAFAEGGRPPIGKVSVVGDGGEPELFVPDTAGSIIPFSKLGGGGTTLSIGSMVFPGITNAHEAKRAAGAAGRELLSVMSAAQRYA